MYLPDLNPKPAGRTTDLIAIVQPAVGAGTVIFFDTSGGGSVEIGSAPTTLDPYLMGQSRATYTAPADMATGAYQLVAVFQGNDTYAGSQSEPMLFNVGPRPTTTTVAASSPHDLSGATARKGEVLTISVSVVDTGMYSPNAPLVAGTVEIKVDGATVGTPTLGAGLPTSQAGVELPTAGWTLGTHAITAAYSPGADTDHAASSTAVAFNVSLIAGPVDATGVGLQYATFYPYKDGYRDTVAAIGSRSAPASISVRIYSPAGALVKSAAVASGTGAYAVPWNGRTSSGAMRPAGKYKVVQVLTNLGGTHLTVTSYVNLSAKHLYTYTATLHKGVAAGVFTTKRWIGWEFKLPAAFAYKGLTVSVYGWTANQPGLLGAQDYTVCPWWGWDPSCVVRSTSVPTAWGWKSVTASLALDRLGRAVTVFAWAAPGGTIHAKYARVRVTYTVLK